MGFKTIEGDKGNSTDWTYRPNLFLLIPSFLFVIGLLMWIFVAAIIEAIDGTGCDSAKCGGGVPVAVLLGIVFLPVCVTFASGMFVYIRVSRGVLSARRLWWRKFEIPVTSVRSLTPGYYGMTITTVDGRKYRSTTPQQANATAWQKKRGISGDVADRIMAATAANQGIIRPSTDG